MLAVKLDMARKELKKVNGQDKIGLQKRARPTYQELMERRAMKPFYMPEEPLSLEVQYDKNVSRRLLNAQTRHLSSKFIEKEMISKEELKDKLLDLPKLLPEIDAKYVHTEKKKPKRISINLGHKSTIISSKDYFNEGTKRSMVDPLEKKRRADRENSQYPHYRLQTAKRHGRASINLRKSGDQRNSIINENNIKVNQVLAPIVKKALTLSENNNEEKSREISENLSKTIELDIGDLSNTDGTPLANTTALSGSDKETSSSVSDSNRHTRTSDVSTSSSKSTETPTLPPLVIMNHNFLSYPFTKKNPEMKHKGIARNPMGGFYFS